MEQSTLAVIIGNRNFFPDHLIGDAQKKIIELLKKMNIRGIMTDENTTKMGAVETLKEARACAALFKKHRDDIDGILVALPNFGDEQGVGEAIRDSGLDVPILVQASPDSPEKMSIENRRDSFCGKLSVCNILRQYGYPFSLTSSHTSALDSAEFEADLDRFMRVCRVVKKLKRARIGAIGARPNSFKTVRYSEKILEAYGISVSTADLSEIIGEANNLPDSEPRIKAKIDEIRSYTPTGETPDEAIEKMARFGVVLSEWMEIEQVDATAIQCWTSLQTNLGVNCCTIMSMMSENLLPSACEVDVTGALSMIALQCASGTPSALVDWNNNYGDDPDKCVLFHCGNWAKSLISDMKMHASDILGATLGCEVAQGALSGRIPGGPLTFARISTDDTEGIISCYVGEGAFTDDQLSTFGSVAVVRIPEFQYFMKFACLNGFEHHVAVNASSVASILEEAFGTYLGWEVYCHG
jgi:L-fucose isomerase-like protein